MSDAAILELVVMGFLGGVMGVGILVIGLLLWERWWG